jgi:hypothetical protein
MAMNGDHGARPNGRRGRRAARPRPRRRRRRLVPDVATSWQRADDHPGPSVMLGRSDLGDVSRAPPACGERGKATRLLHALQAVADAGCRAPTVFAGGPRAARPRSHRGSAPPGRGAWSGLGNCRQCGRTSRPSTGLLPSAPGTRCGVTGTVRCSPSERVARAAPASSPRHRAGDDLQLPARHRRSSRAARRGSGPRAASWPRRPLARRRPRKAGWSSPSTCRRVREE